MRDAQVFGFITETETCVGWNYGRLEELYDTVTVAWHPYGHLVSQLPPELRERHDRIFGAAIGRAQAQGWSPYMGEDEA